MRGLVRTVCGDIDAAELGPTYCHEHLLTKPGDHLVRDDADLVLDDEEKAAAELGAFRRAGGRSLVEVTTPEFGRDPAGLRRLSQLAQVHVVATAGHVSEEYWRGVLEEGFGGQLCLSADFARRRYLEAWGGAPGYRYILERFLPLLREAGLSEEGTRRLVVDNPARPRARK